MSNFCTYCGKPLEKGAKFCIDCGQPILRTKPKKFESKKEDSAKAKKESKYVITSSQRDIFLQKILPTMLVGSIIWLISEIIFSTIFIELEFNRIFLAFYISMIIIEINLFILLYFISKIDKYGAFGLIIFFIFSFNAGILSLPVVMITEFLPQVHMFVFLSVGATLIVCFVGALLRERYFAKGYLWAHIILFLIGTSIIEIIFILIFTIRNFLLTIPISLSYILVVSLTAMFYGAKAVQKNEKDPWLYIFFKIEGILLVALIVAAVIVVVVLIIIAAAIACGGGDFDLSGLSGGRSKSKKRKQKE
jgi:hypothetical protein